MEDRTQIKQIADATDFVFLLLAVVIKILTYINLRIYLSELLTCFT